MTSLTQLQPENQRLYAELAQLWQHNDRLQKSEARYRQVVENAPISMVFANTDGYITQMNAAAEQLFGLTREEFNQQICPIISSKTSFPSRKGSRCH